MKGSWPKVTGSIRFEFDADHAMPRIGKGCECRHTHHYVVTFGWTHEIMPRMGYTHELMEHRRDFADLIDRVAGKYLNDILPMQPSAEVLALWLLAQTQPAYCDHVIVQTYDDYTVRADRGLQRSEWMMFLAGLAPDPFSTETFTLK
jgi:6-pyruvoyl-tetrahydropterin synthase